MSTPFAQPTLLWDGDCTFCRYAVALARRLDRRGRFAIVPYQEIETATLEAVGLSASRCASALQCVVNGHVFSGAFAANAFARRITWLAPIVIVLERIPLFIAMEAIGYALVAANRGALARFLRLR